MGNSAMKGIPFYSSKYLFFKMVFNFNADLKWSYLGGVNADENFWNCKMYVDEIDFK